MCKCVFFLKKLLLFSSLNISSKVVTDPSGKQTTGKITKYEASPFGTSSATASIGNGDVNITVKASRSLHIEAEVVSGSGQTTHVVWQQELSYSNTQFYLNDFNIQNLVQSSLGTSTSTHNGETIVRDIFDFPVAINLSGNATTSMLFWSSDESVLKLAVSFLYL